MDCLYGVYPGLTPPGSPPHKRRTIPTEDFMSSLDPQSEFSVAELPLITADMPGISGTLKSCPEDFVVEEIPAYLPCGEGDHLFLWIEKRSVPADQLGRHLANALRIKPRDLGTAGMKDTHAVTRQFVSVPRQAEERLSAIENDNIRLLNATPHRNKLKTGHLKGNRFSILLRGARCPGQADDDILPNAQAITERLRKTGVPNYFGSQRFGNKNSTLKLGMKLLTEARSQTDAPREAAKPNRRFLHRLALSAAQSWLFNQILAERLNDGLSHQLMLGDVMQVCASGGCFDVRDLAVEQPRFDARETVIAGPMFGPKMKPTLHEPAIREQRVLQSAGLTMDAFRRFGDLTNGTRRPLLIWLNDLQVDSTTDGLQFDFSLPSGAYATVVLREFMKIGESESTESQTEPEQE